MPQAAQELLSILQSQGFNVRANLIGYVPGERVLGSYKGRCRADRQCAGLHPVDEDTYILGWWRRG